MKGKDSVFIYNNCIFLKIIPQNDLGYSFYSFNNFGVLTNEEIIETTIISIISLGGNTIIRSSITAIGFFKMLDSRAVVTTAMDKTESMFNNILNA